MEIKENWVNSHYTNTFVGLDVKGKNNKAFQQKYKEFFSWTWDRERIIKQGAKMHYALRERLDKLFHNNFKTL